MFENIIKKLSQILIDSDEFSDVYTYEVEQFKGDPVAVITPSSNESDYETFSDNIRTYAFNVRIFVKRNSPRNADEAEEVMRSLVTSVIDDFDKNYTLSGIEVPAGYTFLNVFAAPSSWGYAGDVDEFRVAEVNVRCRVSVNLNLL